MIFQPKTPDLSVFGDLGPYNYHKKTKCALVRCVITLLHYVEKKHIIDDRYRLDKDASERTQKESGGYNA